MARIHRITHPTLGITTWKLMQAAQKRVSAKQGFNVCVWCHGAVPPKARTRCANRNCHAMAWEAQSYSRVRKVHLRREPLCRICCRRGREVDHIVPVSLGGTGDHSNLRTLCTPCHRAATNALRKQGSKYKAAGAV